jgi:hypothetical protein
MQIALWPRVCVRDKFLFPIRLFTGTTHAKATRQYSTRPTRRRSLIGCVDEQIHRDHVIGLRPLLNVNKYNH